MSPYRESADVATWQAAASTEVELEIDDMAYGGWKSGEVRLVLEELAHSFSLNYISNRHEGATRPIRGQDTARVLIAGQGVIEGYVFGKREYEDAERYELSVSGRSVTADLVDCDAVGGPWTNATLETIARSLCDPFGIQVEVRAMHAVSSERFGTFAVQRGEKAHEALARAARRRGVLMVSENGLLVFELAGARSTATVLERGVNLLSKEWTSDWSQRFSPITFRGQTRATRDTYGESSAIIRNQVEDPAVIRHRPQSIQQGTIEGTRDLGVAAIHQRNRQAALGERLTVSVQGWLNAEGKHWRPNTLVRVRDTTLSAEEMSLLVVEAGYAFDAESDKGRVTQLVLSRPEAFDMVDYPAVRIGEGWGS